METREFSFANCPHCVDIAAVPLPYKPIQVTYGAIKLGWAWIMASSGLYLIWWGSTLDSSHVAFWSVPYWLWVAWFYPAIITGSFCAYGNDDPNQDPHLTRILVHVSLLSHVLTPLLQILTLNGLLGLLLLVPTLLTLVLTTGWSVYALYLLYRLARALPRFVRANCVSTPLFLYLDEGDRSQVHLHNSSPWHNKNRDNPKRHSWQIEDGSMCLRLDLGSLLGQGCVCMIDPEYDLSMSISCHYDLSNAALDGFEPEPRLLVEGADGSGIMCQLAAHSPRDHRALVLNHEGLGKLLEGLEARNQTAGRVLDEWHRASLAIKEKRGAFSRSARAQSAWFETLGSELRAQAIRRGRRE